MTDLYGPRDDRVLRDDRREGPARPPLDEFAPQRRCADSSDNGDREELRIPRGDVERAVVARRDEVVVDVGDREAAVVASAGETE